MLEQQHRPQIDCSCPYSDKPKAASEPAGVLQEQEIPTPRPPQEADSCYPETVNQGSPALLHLALHSAPTRLLIPIL